MKCYSSLHTKLKKKKDIISKNGEVKFNNLKNNISSKGKKKSSHKWLARQINDPFTKAAKIEGYLARSAYKLIEIQNKYNIFTKKIDLILDLGCSPGSWSQVILTKYKILKNTQIIGIDLLPIKFTHPNLYFIQGDFEDKNTQKQILDKMKKLTLQRNCYDNIYPSNNIVSDKTKSRKIKIEEKESSTKADINNNSKNGNNCIDNVVKTIIKIDCIVCDIAPNNIGNSDIDRMRSESILEAVLLFCEKYLAKHGNMICKAIKGADNYIYPCMRKVFENVHRFKPKSSHKDSSEIFLIGINKV